MSIEKQLISITDTARKKFEEMLFDADKRDGYLKISLELDGTQMYYAMDVVNELSAGDKTYDFGNLKIVINEEDELLLKGLKIDYIQDEEGEQFTLDNPNMIDIYDDNDGGCCGRGCCCN